MKRTLSKVLTELSKESPDLSYIRGLLEGLVDEEPVVISAMPKIAPMVNHPNVTLAQTAEAPIGIPGMLTLEETIAKEANAVNNNIAKFGSPNG